MILSFLRTAVLYILLIAVIRIMGKRQIGQMEPSEFVVTMLAANLAAIPMEDSGIPLYAGAVPILTVLGVELVLSGISMGSIRFRRILCGKPVILIENGRILRENLLKTRITLDENLRTRPYIPHLFASPRAMIPVIDPDQVILEVKFDDFLPGYLATALADSPKAPMAISKFALCMNFI